MYVLQRLTRFVIPATELAYRGDLLKMHQNVAAPAAILEAMKRA
jgi:hypothetical protein